MPNFLKAILFSSNLNNQPNLMKVSKLQVSEKFGVLNKTLLQLKINPINLSNRTMLLLIIWKLLLSVVKKSKKTHNYLNQESQHRKLIKTKKSYKVHFSKEFHQLKKMKMKKMRVMKKEGKRKIKRRKIRKRKKMKVK